MADTSWPSSGNGTSTVLNSRRRLRDVFGSFATGVTVVTVGGGDPRGTTVSSFTAVPLDPPLSLVRVARTASLHQHVSAGGTSAVSVLPAGQEEPARRFTDRTRRPVRTISTPWTPNQAVTPEHRSSPAPLPGSSAGS
ncbi:MAG TPA: flavin reductase family protein [Streptomyces sp.]|uniref:flavin reductase family protein n=1 Tax=Streptomyces sp. TaxID=1931 RepID=UPI002B6D2CF5|nr:flavin reductase family protein [Streptomyces sp.]HWU08260.1 flavin reductase family protein [Streptomyces sp.]